MRLGRCPADGAHRPGGSGAAKFVAFACRPSEGNGTGRTRLILPPGLIPASSRSPYQAGSADLSGGQGEDHGEPTTDRPDGIPARANGLTPAFAPSADHPAEAQGTVNIPAGHRGLAPAAV